MQAALRNRLIFGPLLLAAAVALFALDYAVEVYTARFGWVRYPQGNVYGVGGVGLLIILVLLVPPATLELARLFAAENVRPYRFISALGSGLLGLHAFLTQFPAFQPIAASTLAFIIVFVMLFAALRTAWGRRTDDAIHSMAGTVLATLYLGGLSWFTIALRVKHAQHYGVVRFHGSTMVILLIVFVTKFTDIGAFFGGTLLGRHPLIPWLSPKKTWEGLFCGLATAALVCIALAPLVPNVHLPWYKALFFGAALGGIGQLGDLLESLMKRDAQVKDSGKFVPGFGGVLDLIDSPLLASPFAYLMFSLL